MKHLFIIVTVLGILTPSFVYAGGVDGRSTIFQQLVQIGAETPTKFASISTSISTGRDMLKNVVLDPLANALISSALQGVSNDVLSWVSGGFSGKDPLIVGDPESFIKNKGLGLVKGALDNIPTDTPFGDSIFNSILSQYKGEGDGLSAKLKELSKSQLPGIIQSNLCTDQQLTSLAIGAVQNSDGSYDPTDVTNKKTELYNYACGASNSPSDPEVAARLEDLNAQNPEVGGWDAWLLLTGGENNFTHSVLAVNEVADDKDKKEDMTVKDIFDGQGPISERECLEYETDTAPGEDAMCKEWTTVTPGDQVGTTLSEALNSGMNRLENIMGEGSLTGMLQGFAISAITSGIKKALNNVGGATSASGQKVNLPTTLRSSRPIVQDLLNNPTEKAESQKPMNSQLKYYSTALDGLSSIDSRFLSDLTSYESRVIYIKDWNPTMYADRMSRITPVKNSILAEQAKITEARTLITNTQAKLDATNSSQEQRTIFYDYMAAVVDRGLPNLQAEGVRETEYTQRKVDIEGDRDLSNAISAYDTWKQQQLQIQTAPVIQQSDGSPGQG